MRLRVAKFETEVKIPVRSAREARRLLRKAGFRPTSRRTFEANVILDTPSLTLKTGDAVLRLRRFGGRSTLTYKGPTQRGRHKRRLEAEVEISDTSTAEWILQQLGFRVVFRYEKYRTGFARTRGEGRVFLDETPIGCFLELEGSSRWIDDTARLLGVSRSFYITKTYMDLYREFRKIRAETSDRTCLR
ncbi:MAG: class IV adenylate cyclase [Bryobacterales bacterium]|nr:class IV adenylate cyclase [Bryobacteraceae bacterium]MDW8354462.1 class IV adenylate cyclase [Bryobacterales bacterium]